MAFAVAKDAVRTTVASYTLGSGSLTVATGQGSQFPVPTASAPILITVITAASYASYPETFCTYQATGITSDTLTGLTVIDGVDTSWAVGAIVEMRTCAKHINDLESACTFIGEVSQTSSFSAVVGLYYVLSGSSAITVTMPTAASIAGQAIRIRCAGGYTGLCTIVGTGGQTIGGATSQIIYAGESPLLQSDGANWVRTGGMIIPCRAQLTLGTTQTLTNNTAATVQFDTAGFDNTGQMLIAVSNQIKALRPGQYRIGSGIYFGNITTATSDVYVATIQVAVNGSNINIASQPCVAGPAIPFSFIPMLIGIATLAAGDLVTITAKVFHAGAQSVDLQTGNPTYFEVEEIPSW